MSTRQYIGARYVIKVYENSQNANSAEWEANTYYEPLVMVTYNNSSYLSKKDVPATVGNPAQNPSYWVITGAYNGQIAYLQTEIDTLNELVNNIGNRKFWFIGDSFMNATALVNALNANFGVSDSHVTAEGAIGYCNTGMYGTTDLATLISNDTDVPNDITDVVIVCGCNDCKSTYYTTIRNMVFSAITAVRSKAPKANIYGVFNATYYDISNSYYSDAQISMSRIFETIKSTYNSYNNKVFFLESPFYSIQNVNYITSDGTHPTTQGYQVLANAIYKSIHGVNDSNSCLTNTVNGIMFKTCASNGILSMTILGAQTLYDGDPVNFSAGNSYTDFDPIAIPVRPKYNRHFSINVLLKMTKSDNTTEVVNCNLIILRDTLKMCILSPIAISNVVKIDTITDSLLDVPFMKYQTATY